MLPAEWTGIGMDSGSGFCYMSTSMTVRRPVPGLVLLVLATGERYQEYLKVGGDAAPTYR